MKKKITKEYIYFRESAFQSILADFFTFAFLGILFAFNHFYMADSKVTAFFFFIVFLISALSKGNSKAKKFTDKEKLKEYIKTL